MQVSPQVKFVLDQELDTVMAIKFLKMPPLAGVDFAQSTILDVLPGLDSRDKVDVQSYFEDYNSKYRHDLELIAGEIQQSWDQISDEYFRLNSYAVGAYSA